MLLLPSATQSSFPCKAALLAFVPAPHRALQTQNICPQSSEELCCSAVLGGTPKPDTLWDEPAAQSTGLWSNVAIPGHSATWPGTTGSSKSTGEPLITGPCAAEHCLHTGQEVKGYGVSGSRAPTLTPASVSSPELCLCCTVPKPEQQQQITALWDHGISSRLKGTSHPDPRGQRSLPVLQIPV